MRGQNTSFGAKVKGKRGATLSNPHSPLKLLRMNTSTSVDSKGVAGGRRGTADFEGVRRTAWRGRMVRRARKNRADFTKPL